MEVQRARVFFFVAGFLLLFGTFQLLLGWFVWGTAGFDRYLAWNTEVASWLLSLLDGSAEATDGTLSTAGFSIEVKRGCDGLQPLAVFFSGVLPFPARWSQRAWGLLVGTVLLLSLNVVRIASLVVIGEKFHGAFELAHMTVWPGLLILAALVAWAAWAMRVLDAEATDGAR